MPVSALRHHRPFAPERNLRRKHGLAVYADGKRSTPRIETGLAADLNGVNQYLNIASNATLQMGAGVRMTMAAWFTMQTIPAVSSSLFGKSNSGGGSLEYVLFHNNTGPNSLDFVVSKNGGGGGNTATARIASPAASAKFFVACRYDGVNISISLNAGVPVTQPWTEDIFAGTANFAIGVRNGTAFPMDGDAECVGLWKSALTDGQITTLYNNGVPMSPDQAEAAGFRNASLNPVSYWRCNETAGQRYDAWGTNHLTANNSPGTVPGGCKDGVSALADLSGRGNSFGTPPGLAASFDGVNQYLNRAINASLEVSDIDFSAGLWVTLGDTPPGSTWRTLMGQWDQASGANRAWSLFLDNGGWGGGGLVFKAAVNSTGGGATAFAAASDFGAPVNGGLYFVGMTHSATNDLLTIRVNNVANSTAYASGVFTSPADFEIGRLFTTGGYLKGNVESAFFIKRELSAAEWTAAYNNGVPLAWDQWQSLGLPVVGTDGGATPMSFWRGGESSGTRSDSSNTNHLTSNNAVGSTAGNVRDQIYRVTQRPLLRSLQFMGQTGQTQSLIGTSGRNFSKGFTELFVGQTDVAATYVITSIFTSFEGASRLQNIQAADGSWEYRAEQDADAIYVCRTAPAGTWVANTDGIFLGRYDGGLTDAAVTLWKNGIQVDSASAGAGVFTGIPSTTTVRLNISGQNTGSVLPFVGRNRLYVLCEWPLPPVTQLRLGRYAGRHAGIGTA